MKIQNKIFLQNSFHSIKYYIGYKADLLDSWSIVKKNIFLIIFTLLHNFKYCIKLITLIYKLIKKK